MALFSSGLTSSPSPTFTPGKWIADRGFRDAMAGGEHTTIADDYMTVFLTTEGPQHDTVDPENVIEVHGPNQEANARLIASAPDLYDFAQNVAGMDDSFIAHTHDLTVLRETLREFRRDARAALSKALGQ